MTYENKALTNRGFIRGPFCTIYGLGALSVYFLLRPLADHYFALFMCGMVMATLLELVTAKLMTRLFGSFWWNYDNKRLNYRGVICLESSVCWGVMSLCTFTVFQPVVERIVNLYYNDYGKIIAILLLSLYILDFSTSFKRALNNADKQEQSESAIHIHTA